MVLEKSMERASTRAGVPRLKTLDVKAKIQKACGKVVCGRKA